MKCRPRQVYRFLFVGLFLLCGASFAELPSFTQEKLSGGSVTDGLDVSEIRQGRHPDFDRLVLDVTWWEGAGSEAGQPAESAGHFHIEPVTVGKEYVIELGGFRAFGAALPEFSDASRILSLVRQKGEAYEDDSTISLLFQIRPGFCYRAFSLDSPARIVIDVADCPR